MPDKEYISREAILAKCAYEQPWGADAVIAMIEDFHAADVRPVVRGKWIKAEVQPYFRKHYNVEVCSVCQYRKNGKWNYCPNCGADMREES